MLVDDEGDQSISNEAFAVLHHIVRIRLERQRLTVIDATNLGEAARRPLLEMARSTKTPSIAIVFNLSLRLLLANNHARPGRLVPDEAISEQAEKLAKAIPRLGMEGYLAVYHLDESSLSGLVIERKRAGSL